MRVLGAYNYLYSQRPWQSPRYLHALARTFIYLQKVYLSFNSPAPELTAIVQPKGRVKVRDRIRVEVRVRVRFSVSVSLNKNNSGAVN